MNYIGAKSANSTLSIWVDQAFGIFQSCHQLEENHDKIPFSISDHPRYIIRFKNFLENFFPHGVVCSDIEELTDMVNIAFHSRLTAQ